MSPFEIFQSDYAIFAYLATALIIAVTLFVLFTPHDEDDDEDAE